MKSEKSSTVSEEKNRLKGLTKEWSKRAEKARIDRQGRASSGFARSSERERRRVKGLGDNALHVLHGSITLKI